MTTHPVKDDELMAYVDGELEIERAAEVAVHLEHCRECQGAAADLQSVSRRLLEWQIEESSPSLQHRVTEALKMAEAPKTNTARKRHYLLVRPWVWVSSTAAVVILFSGLMKWSRMDRAEKIAYNGPAAGSAGLIRRGPGAAMTGSVGLESANGVIGGVAGGVPRAAPSPEPSQYIEAGRPLIARTAQINLITRDFDGTRPEVTRIVNSHAGYIAQLALSAPSDQGRSLSATLRAPAAQLDALLSELRKLGRVESESQSGEEVTDQYIDLTARLKNARNAEQRLTEILRQRTGRLSDVLAVEEQIDRTRGEIERMDAELKNLSTRIALATVQLQIVEEYKEPLRVDHSSTLGRLRNAAVEGYRSVVNGVIGLVIFLLAYGPGLLIAAAILFFPLRAVWRMRRGMRSPAGT